MTRPAAGFVWIVTPGLRYWLWRWRGIHKSPTLAKPPVLTLPPLLVSEEGMMEDIVQVCAEIHPDVFVDSEVLMHPRLTAHKDGPSGCFAWRRMDC